MMRFFLKKGGVGTRCRGHKYEGPMSGQREASGRRRVRGAGGRGRCAAGTRGSQSFPRPAGAAWGRAGAARDRVGQHGAGPQRLALLRAAAAGGRGARAGGRLQLRTRAPAAAALRRGAG